MNSATTLDLPAAIADDASDEAKLDYYYLAFSMILEDIGRRDQRIGRMQEQNRKKLSELDAALDKLRHLR